MVKCYFSCDGDENIFLPQEMPRIPSIGEILFIESESNSYKIVDVQYQFTKTKELRLVNIVLKEIKG